MNLETKSRRKVSFNERMQLPFPVLFRTLLEIKPASSDRVVARRIAKTPKRYAELTGLLKKLSAQCDVELQVPALPVMNSGGDGYAIAQQFNEELQRIGEELYRQLATDRIGRWRTIDNDTVEYTWFEDRKGFGIMTRNVSRVQGTHRIINARFRHLPAQGFKLPRRAKQIEREILKCDYSIVNAFGFLTGYLVAENEQEMETWQEETWVAKAIKSRAAKVAALAGIIGTGLAGVASAAGPLVATAAIDPCYTFADISWFGFKE